MDLADEIDLGEVDDITTGFQDVWYSWPRFYNGYEPFTKIDISNIVGTRQRRIFVFDVWYSVKLHDTLPSFVIMALINTGCITRVRDGI
ncbi:predicted protein [Lichtheimia corymbifera JMRC:FSU:9682]|uniref:Uncharacterized protein n=1 Tax=Lichtheimia corymbifera JMRC:FSU:9682 TaxID=1263082 RepID=A0A068S921_9FUNG|nr:predicted protein [Lichtheimia corymbifera JMRC:FSU:9682]